MKNSGMSVVIVNWNSCDDVVECVRSLKAQTDPELEIVVVDNGSTDGSAAMLRREFPDITVLDAGENLGFAEGCNRGIEVTHAPWVFLFNNDAVAEPDLIEKLRAAAISAPDNVGMIQPRIVFRQCPSRVNSTGVLVFTNGYARDRHFSEPVEHAQVPEDTFCVTAGAALYRRAMLDAVRLPSGYLDRRFFMYFEDVDLGWRCRLNGWRAIYVPDAVVRHRFQGSSSRRGHGFVERQCRINRMRTLLKNASGRFVTRTIMHTIGDILMLTRYRGRPALRQLAEMVIDSLRERSMVGRMCTVPRWQVEREWITTVEFPTPDFELQAATVLSTSPRSESSH